jgi:hypothetical protein
MELRITQLEVDQELQLWNDGELQLYLDDDLYETEESNYSNVPFKSKERPWNGHAVPFVTNHRYHIHW